MVVELKTRLNIMDKLVNRFQRLETALKLVVSSIDKRHSTDELHHFVQKQTKITVDRCHVTHCM